MPDLWGLSFSETDLTGSTRAPEEKGRTRFGDAYDAMELENLQPIVNLDPFVEVLQAGNNGSCQETNCSRTPGRDAIPHPGLRQVSTRCCGQACAVPKCHLLGVVNYIHIEMRLSIEKCVYY